MFNSLVGSAVEAICHPIADIDAYEYDLMARNRGHMCTQSGSETLPMENPASIETNALRSFH